MRALAAGLAFLALTALAALAQEPKPAPDPCGDCRTAAESEKRRCDAAAQDAAATELCAKRISESMLACQVGACKPGVDPRLAALCPDCQHRAAEEEKACRRMRIGSPEHASCVQRAGRMKADCEERYCRLAPPR